MGVKLERFKAAFRTSSTNQQRFDRALEQVKSNLYATRDSLAAWNKRDPSDGRAFKLKHVFDKYTEEARKAAFVDKAAKGVALLEDLEDRTADLLVEVTVTQLQPLPEHFEEATLLDWPLLPADTHSEWIRVQPPKIHLSVSAESVKKAHKTHGPWVQEAAADAARPFRQKALEAFEKASEQAEAKWNEQYAQEGDAVAQDLARLNKTLNELAEQAAEAAMRAVHQRIHEFDVESEASAKVKRKMAKNIITGTVTASVWVTATVLSGGTTAFAAWYGAAGFLRVGQELYDISKSAAKVEEELRKLVGRLQERLEAAGEGIGKAIQARGEHAGSLTLAALLKLGGVPGDLSQALVSTGKEAKGKLDLMRMKIHDVDKKTEPLAAALGAVLDEIDDLDGGSLSDMSKAATLAPVVKKLLEQVVALQSSIHDSRAYAGRAEAVIRGYDRKISVFKSASESARPGVADAYEALWNASLAEAEFLEMEGPASALVEACGDLAELAVGLL